MTCCAGGLFFNAASANRNRPVFTLIGLRITEVPFQVLEFHPEGSGTSPLRRCFGVKMLLLGFSETELISQLLITRRLIFKFLRVLGEVLRPV